MTKTYFPKDFLRMLRNQVPIDTVITSFLNMEARTSHNLLRFKYPLCGHFHTAVNPKIGLVDKVVPLKNLKKKQESWLPS